MTKLIESFEEFTAEIKIVEHINEEKNEYKIEFGDYSIELKGNQLLFNKGVETVKVTEVKSSFNLNDLRKLAKTYATQLNLLNKLPFEVLMVK